MISGIEGWTSIVMASRSCQRTLFHHLIWLAVVPFINCLVAAQDPEVSSNGEFTLWFPVNWPNGTSLLVNAGDSIVMSYESQLQMVNASMWCLTKPTSSNSYTGLDLDSPRKQLSILQRARQMNADIF